MPNPSSMIQSHSQITFKIGDVVRAYRKGIHVITRFDDTPGKSSNGLVFYRPVLSAAMKPIKGKAEDCCDIAYCKHVTPDVIEKELAEITQAYQSAIKLIESL